jgi:hypothetical protein
MTDAPVTEPIRVRASDEMPWACAPVRGVSYKSLRFDPESRAGAVLVHMCPGTTYARAKMHAGAEILVLDGELDYEGRRIARGGYVYLPPGIVAAPSTEAGCVLFVTFPGRVENLYA